jgi:tetratricopeptide (TPR) repeat protein
MELRELEALRAPVRDALGDYWAVFVDIYARTAQAWLMKARGDDAAALVLMREAATMDDGHEKHIYLENKILPMREALGDMEAGQGHPSEALAAYQASLKLAPNRYRSLLGAAEAARARGDKSAARDWFTRLLALSQLGDQARPGVALARAYLASAG